MEGGEDSGIFWAVIYDKVEEADQICYNQDRT